MTRDIEDIKAKIRKLLAADPSSQGAEAETAGRQAAKLMAKFELDEYDLGGGKEAIHDFDLTTDQPLSNRPGKRNAAEVPSGISTIGLGVALYCGLHASRGGSSLNFNGRRPDVELGVWLHNTLVTRCYEASKEACAGQGVAAASRWRNGYAIQIQRRLRNMREERESAEKELVSSGGTALVVVRDQLSTAIKERFGEIKTKNARSATSDAGHEAGARAHIPTNRPLTA